MLHEILFSGFGGQGILFAGKVMSYIALAKEQEVSWLPSYGPEMRGGTAYCAVIVSDSPIGSPVIYNPTVLIAMNKPSAIKFVDSVQPGGHIIIDSALIDSCDAPDNVNLIKIPATKIAHDLGTPKLANMVILGKMLQVTGIATVEEAIAGIKKSVGSRKTMVDTNVKALETGYNYVC